MKTPIESVVSFRSARNPSEPGSRLPGHGGIAFPSGPSRSFAEGSGPSKLMPVVDFEASCCWSFPFIVQGIDSGASVLRLDLACGEIVSLRSSRVLGTCESSIAGGPGVRVPAVCWEERISWPACRIWLSKPCELGIAAFIGASRAASRFWENMADCGTSSLLHDLLSFDWLDGVAGMLPSSIPECFGRLGRFMLFGWANSALLEFRPGLVRFMKYRWKAHFDE